MRTLELVDNLRQGGAQDARSIIEGVSRINRGINAQALGVAVSNNASVGLTGVFDSTQITASALYNDQDFGFRSIETLSAQLALQHRLSRRLSAYGDVFFRHADTNAGIDDCIANPALFGFNQTLPGFNALQVCSQFINQQGRTNTVGGRVGLNYQVYSNVSAFAEYAYTNNFSDNAFLEFEENFANVGLTIRF